MILIDGLDAITEPIARSTVAIGTFDGIHRGHRTIIAAAAADARQHGRSAVVFTFDRHPEELLRPDRNPDYLTTGEQRRVLVEQLDVDALVVARFDLALSQLSPEQFVRSILLDRLGAEEIVMGADFRFGKGRAGDVAFLRAFEDGERFEVTVIDPVLLDGDPVSSTHIRELIHAGRVSEAERLLGHEYWLAGTVVHGQQLGRTLGFPTANLETNQAIPADGIYATLVRLADGRELAGACSIGVRPTIPGAGRSIEIYLLDFDEPLYGACVEVRFIEKLRNEEKFDSIEALQVQIALDVEQTRAVCEAAGYRPNLSR